MPGEDAIRAAVKIGANGGFTKPLDIDALMGAVREIGEPPPAEDA